MSKAILYVAARSGSRASKEVLTNAKNHFISTGNFAGPADLASEIANFALELGWAIIISINAPVVSIKRNLKLV